MQIRDSNAWDRKVTLGSCQALSYRHQTREQGNAPAAQRPEDFAMVVPWNDMHNTVFNRVVNEVSKPGNGDQPHEKTPTEARWGSAHLGKMQVLSRVLYRTGMVRSCVVTRY